MPRPNLVHTRLLRRGVLTLLVLAGLWTGFAVPAHAGGGPENVVLIVDPTEPDALHVANYYRAARGIPGRNVIYMQPDAANYAAFTEFQLPALFGTLANRDLEGHVDYVVVAPGGSFYVPAPDLIISDACSAPVRRMAISAAYSLAFLSDGILNGQPKSTQRNHYFTTDEAARALDSRTAWRNGAPSTQPGAERYFIGFMLGYTGQRGNTVDELLTMIDRSIQADGSQPDGTFYLMKTTDVARSTARHWHFPTIINELQLLGGKAEQIDAVLPEGRHDALGVITGAAGPKIRQADMTLLPGAYADHMTSYAGRFDGAGQTKMSEWIARGASGTAGTVEEPCAVTSPPGITGKFPHPRLFVWYYQGLSLGEALLRSMMWTPYQGLFYGDPLTRPYARFPTVGVTGVPQGQASGTVTLAPQTESGQPDKWISDLDLFIDGAWHSRITPWDTFVIDTTRLADGYHDLRAVAYEDDLVRSQGEWRGALHVNNYDRTVQVSATPEEGDRDTAFTLDVSAGGGPVAEIRLVQDSRVLAATKMAETQFALSGRVLGAGPVELMVVAEYADGRLAFSEPLALDITATGGEPPETPGPAVPTAHDYTLDALPGTPILLDLPATDRDGDALTRTILSDPAQATVESDGVAWLLRPRQDAQGTDSLVFSASDGSQDSEAATVTIRYCTPPRISTLCRKHIWLPFAAKLNVVDR